MPESPSGWQDDVPESWLPSAVSAEDRAPRRVDVPAGKPVLDVSGDRIGDLRGVGSRTDRAQHRLVAAPSGLTGPLFGSPPSHAGHVDRHHRTVGRLITILR